MRWRGRRRSTNVTDHRRRGGGKVAGGLGGGAIVLAIAVYFLTGNEQAVQQVLSQSQRSAPSQSSQPLSAAEQEQVAFIETILATTEDVWKGQFANAGQSYRQPELGIFEGRIETACGIGQSAMGPFYCPGDQKIYIDPSFFRQLARMGGPGDFAQAYVIGHEVAHHIQKITGIEPKMRQMQRRVRSQEQQNQLLVLLELQADCLAGVWAHQAHRADPNQPPLLEDGDIEEGLRAAASIGDDTLQRNAGQPIQPGKFTHGTSAQRTQWLRRGLSSGDINQCDTWAEAGVSL